MATYRANVFCPYRFRSILVDVAYKAVTTFYNRFLRVAEVHIFLDSHNTNFAVFDSRFARPSIYRS